MGERARETFYFIPPNYISYILERKWQFGIITFLIGNQISSIISSSGAFEVLINEKEVWSRLKSNNVPSIEYLISQINRLGYKLNKY